MTDTDPLTNGDSIARHQFQELVGNVLLSRQELIKKFFDPRRDIDDECGYPKTNEITAGHYRGLYDRNPVASRVVRALPNGSWKTPPMLVEDDDPNNETVFEEAWKAMDQGLRRGSWNQQDEQGSAAWELLRRADILSGVGHFGVILLGLNDGADLSAPAPGLDPRTGEPSASRSESQLLFVRAFDESLVTVSRYENDVTSPRFGWPVVYDITFNDPTEQHSGVGLPTATQEVHWTRVIHLADNLGGSEVFGVPRLRPVYNRILDLEKLYGGSAEMYWRGAFPGLAIETHPQLGGNVKVDSAGLRDEMEKYMNSLQRYLSLSGMTAKTLAPTVVDPTPQIDVQLEAIAIELGIPKRILSGSERGELASGQDDSTWNEALADRQRTYLTPRVIVPFVDRLIALGVLPEPGEDGYRIVWPGFDTLGADEQATIAVKMTEAMAKYVQGGVESLMEPMSYLTKVLGLEASDAEAVLDATMEAMEGSEPEEDGDGQAEGVEQRVPPADGGEEDPVPEVR